MKMYCDYFENKYILDIKYMESVYVISNEDDKSRLKDKYSGMIIGKDEFNNDFVIYKREINSYVDKGIINSILIKLRDYFFGDVDVRSFRMISDEAEEENYR